MRASTLALIGSGVLGLAGFYTAPVDVEPEISWHPATPRQGSFVQITIRVPAPGLAGIVAVRGHLAGHPLHFDRTPDGAFVALGGIPSNAAASIPVAVELEGSSGDTEHRMVRIPVEATQFASSQLSVAPRFTQAPDSALQARIAQERRRSGAVYAAAPRTLRLWSGPFVRPVEGRVTSPFGEQRVFNGEIQSRHWGVDLDGDTGAPVVATNRGVVALVGDFYYSGRIVYLDHGRGLVTAYLHLSEILVAEGDTVETGAPIGRIGATGRVTGPHLHWSARFGTLTLDGLTLLDLPIAASEP